MTPETRKKVERGKLIPPRLPDGVRNYFATWPRTLLLRANNLGAAAGLLFVPLPLLALRTFHVQPLDRMSVVLLKGTFAFVVGAVVTPIVAASSSIHLGICRIHVISIPSMHLLFHDRNMARSIVTSDNCQGITW